MNRRFFMTLMGLSFLASASVKEIAALAEHKKPAIDSKLQETESVTFYVAPDGNDNWSGNEETPFASLNRARLAIRELKRQQGGVLQQSVTVWLRGGTHFLSEPLKFTPEDSGTSNFSITFRAYPGENPVISGGKPITEWKQQGDIWVANLPDAKTGWYFRLLRVGDRWATRARYPNLGANPQDNWLYVRPPQHLIEKGGFNFGVQRIHHPGDRLEWNIDVPASGKYQVWLRYAHNLPAYGNLKTMDNRTQLRFGRDFGVWLKNLPATGSFNAYKWSKSASIQLTEGRHHLVWENIKGGGINLDALCFSDDFNWNPNRAIQISREKVQIEQPQPTKHLVIVQMETYSNAEAKEVVWHTDSDSLHSNRLAIDPSKFPAWQKWSGAEICVFMRHNYGNAIFPITDVDVENQSLLGDFRSYNYHPSLGNRLAIENVRQALDSPNEWYLDVQTGELLYWAKDSNFWQHEVVAPAMERLIILEGNPENFVEYLNFQDLTFTDTDYSLANSFLIPTDAAIWLATARKCSIQNCTFTNLGGSGILLEQKSHQNKILGNRMKYLGSHGVLLLGNAQTQPFNNLIAGNKIEDIGKIYKHVGGIYVASGSGNTIAHNAIARTPRYGIYLLSLGSKHYSHRNLVEFNQVIDSSLETADSCAIGTLGRDKQPSNNIIRFNLIRNVVGVGTTQDGKLISPYYTWGIYLDDYSSKTTVYGNIVIGTVLGAVCLHGGQDNHIENNIFVDGSQMQIRLQPRDEFMKGNVFRRNIVVYEQSEAELWYSNLNWRRNCIMMSDFNLYWNRSINIAKTRRNITPEGSFAQWQEAGFDLNSLIADPLFVAPEGNDFRLKSNSPAFKLGFKDIPVKRIGLEGYDANLEV